MRTSLKWLVLAGVPALAPACFSSNNEPPPTDDASSPEPDAQSTPDQTAPPQPEAAPPEAAPDVQADHYVAEAAPPQEASVDAGPAPVTVVVRSALGLEQGATVVYQDAFNQVLGTVLTDALGTASLVVPAGVEVTAFMGNALAPRMVTIESVVPGDTLSVYDTSNDGTTTQVAVDFAPDAGPPPGTNTTYGYIGDCYIYGVPSSTSLGNGECELHGQFPVIVVATSGSDGGYSDFAYTFSKANTVSPDGGTSVLLPGPWYTDLGTETFVAANADAGSLPAGGSWFFSMDEIASSVPTPWEYGFDVSMMPVAAIATHPRFADAYQGEVAFIRYSGATQSVTGIATKPLGDAGTTSFDLTQVLPTIDSVNLQTAGMILTWTSDAGSFPSADGVLAQISWSDTTDAGDSIQGTWALVAPPGVVSATLPAVPTAVASLGPSPSAMFATPTVAVVEADFITGYDQLRAQASALPLSQNLVVGGYGNQVPALPVDGTVKLTAITQAGD
jgi:hypothetical protein